MKKIKYCLRENHLSTSDENRYCASVKNSSTLYQEDIVNLMLDKSTTVTSQDILVVLDLFEEIVKKQILEGHRIITNLFRTGVSIRGGFLSSVDEFDANRHRVSVTMNASSPLKKELAFRARVERDSQDLVQPQIKQVYSFATDSLTTEFAPGALIELKGEYLKGNEKQTRIYLRLEGADEKRSLETIHRVSDRNILCNLPVDLTPGAYWISATVGDGDGDPRCMYSEPVNIS